MLPSTSLDLVAQSPAPRVFLGAAAEHDQALLALAAELEKFAHVDTWRTFSQPGVSILETLRHAATAADFAAFLWGAEDRTTSRDKATPSPRDNVVYEAGLFAGYLGSERTLLVVAPGTKVPTDYLGTTNIEWTSATHVVGRITGVMDRLGPLPRSRIVGDWWQFVTGGYKTSSVLAFFTITVKPDSRTIKIRGRSWNREGVQVATWTCPAAALDEQTMTLHYSWQGPHIAEDELPMFFGTGEIGFDCEPFAGSFSSSSFDSDRRAVRRTTRYLRAGLSDGDILKGTDGEAQTRLIAERLVLQAALAAA